jgi:anti-sigma factor RsiW
MVDCVEARRILWPADGLRVGDAEVEAALAHAEVCVSCSDFLEEDRRVARLIRDSVPRVRAPRELRERLYTALARERAGPRASPEVGRRVRRPWAVAAVLVAGLALGLAGSWLAGGSRRAPMASAFAEDYLRRVVEQDELLTADRQQIASFFARELGVATPPPTVPEFELQRATICLMNGRRGGVVEYESRGRQLSYYIIPHAGKATVESSGVDASTIEGGSSEPGLSSERGLGVATWWDNGHQHALVGNLPAEELKRLAPLFACPSSRL